MRQVRWEGVLPVLCHRAAVPDLSVLPAGSVAVCEVVRRIRISRTFGKNATCVVSAGEQL